MSGFPGRAILVVGEEVTSLKSIQSALSDSSIKVFTLSNPKLVVTFLENHPEISLVFLDPHLPIVNGSTIQSQIQRQFPVFGDRALQIKFISDYGVDQIYHDMGLNLDTVVSKPLRLRDITQLLEHEFGEGFEIGLDQMNRLNEVNGFKRKEYYKAERSLDEYF